MNTVDLTKISRGPTRGPLSRKSSHKCYFADRDGIPVYLTGSHTWTSMQECMSGDPAVEFDYGAYLDWMVDHNHNYMRGWHWEQTSWDQFATERCPVRPMPFARTGVENAKDGLPKFDCTVFNQEYFDRLRDRVSHAADRGIYVSVMLFQGWSTEIRRPNLAVGNPWDGHPLNGANNVNGVDGDAGGTGRAIHTLVQPEITRVQEAYVRKVVDTVNHLDNVLYEIGNEHFEDSYEWQEHMVLFIHQYEKTLPLQHPVGITSGGGGDDSVTNAQLSGSSADWIAPRERNEESAPYCDDPPPPDGRQIILSDTDHLWGIGGNVAWVWKSFCRGLNIAFMDPYEPLHGMQAAQWGRWSELHLRDHPLHEPIRLAMGYSRWFAERMDLATTEPRSDLASSGFCLASVGSEYLVFSETPSEVTVELPADEGEYAVEWFDTVSNVCVDGESLTASGTATLTPPFGHASVLYLRGKR
jgi:hypothetical protein